MSALTDLAAGSDVGLFSPQICPKIFSKLALFNLTENKKSLIFQAFG